MFNGIGNGFWNLAVAFNSSPTTASFSNYGNRRSESGTGVDDRDSFGIAYPDRDVWLPHAKVVLREVFEIGVLDGGEAGNVERALIQQSGPVLLPGHVHARLLDRPRHHHSVHAPSFHRIADPPRVQHRLHPQNHRHLVLVAIAPVLDRQHHAAQPDEPCMNRHREGTGEGGEG